MCRRGQHPRMGNIVVLSHNTNSINNLKLQQTLDVVEELALSGCAVLCLKETKLKTIRAPVGYHVEHVPWEKREGGGLATLIPQQMQVLATSSMELYIHTAIAAEGGQVLHLINM